MPSLNRVNSLCISTTCSRRYTVKSFNILKHEARFENIVLRFLISSESPNSYYKGGGGGRVGARKNRRRRAREAGEQYVGSGSYCLVSNRERLGASPFILG